MKYIQALIRKNSLKVLVFLGLSIMVFTEANGQTNDFKIEIIVDKASSVTAKDGEITINVLNNQSVFNYSIFDKAPREGGKVIEYAEKLSSTSYTFSNLPRGSYYVCVVDENNNSRCIKAEVEAK